MHHNQLVKKSVCTGEFFYEGESEIGNAQATLKFINTEEGRVVMTGALEYQYHLKDHLGNVRLTFTTKDETETALATYETNNEQHEEEKFLRTENVRKVWSSLVDRTNGASDGYAQRLSGGENECFGLARSIAVMPGDKISTEVYAKYFDTSSQDPDISSLVAAIIAQLNGTNPSGPVVDGGSFETSTASFPFAGEAGGLTQNDQTTGAPRAYLNWLVFDRDYVLIPQKSGFKRITAAAQDTVGNGSHERIFSPQITIDQPGYVYIYLSNEEETQLEVFFDDFKVDHIKSPVVQMDDYYPFGLTFNSYQRENSVKNKYLYNQGTGEKTFNTERVFDLDLNVDFSKYRVYDPAMGRWWQVDPKADMFFSLTPYNYSFNDPVRYNDPEGDCPTCPGAFIDLIVSAKLYWDRLSGATQRLASGNSGRTSSMVPSNVQQIQKMVGTANDAKTVVQAVLDGPGRVGSFTDANDITVLMRGSNLDGTKATTSDYVFAGVGAALPISGSAIKKLAGGGLEILEGITKKITNIVGDHLTDKDVTGAVRDILGDPVVIDGKQFDHLGEVNDALKGLGNQLDKLNKAISGGDLTGDVLKEAQRIRSTLQKEKDRIQNLLNKAEKAAQ